MTVQQIKTETLKLPEDSRAKLTQSLLLSLDDTEDDPEHDQIWAEEAARRYRGGKTRDPRTAVRLKSAWRHADTKEVQGKEMGR